MAILFILFTLLTVELFFSSRASVYGIFHELRFIPSSNLPPAFKLTIIIVIINLTYRASKAHKLAITLVQNSYHVTK